MYEYFFVLFSVNCGNESVITTNNEIDRRKKSRSVVAAQITRYALQNLYLQYIPHTAFCRFFFRTAILKRLESLSASMLIIILSNNNQSIFQTRIYRLGIGILSKNAGKATMRRLSIGSVPPQTLELLSLFISSE